MSYQNGTATNLSDLVSQLMTFATGTPGWTQDQLSTGTGQAAMHKGNVYVSFRWATSSPTALGIYQALGYTGGQQPGNHPNDSGNGAVSGTDSTIKTGRCVNDIGNGSFPNYWFFTDTTSQSYIHVVVEISTGIFRHFGFGNLDKIGDWTGGEYCYGNFWNSGGNMLDTTTCCLLDGNHRDTGNQGRSSTMHVESLTGEGGSSKWMEIGGRLTAASNDRAGNAKVIGFGGYRDSPIPASLGGFPAGTTSGLIPTYPIAVWYYNLSATDMYLMGFMKDVRGVNLRFVTERTEVTIGSDTWTFFPLSQRTTTVTTTYSQYSGIAYRKLV